MNLYTTSIAVLSVLLITLLVSFLSYKFSCRRRCIISQAICEPCGDTNGTSDGYSVEGFKKRREGFRRNGIKKAKERFH